MPVLISKMALTIGLALYKNLIAICLLLACAFLSDLAFSLGGGYGQGWPGGGDSFDECTEWELCADHESHV